MRIFQEQRKSLHIVISPSQIYSHWLGVPDILSVVVSRTVIVTCRPDFGFPSALSCGTAYTGLTLRALLNSSSRLSTDGLWIWSTMSCDKPELDSPFTGAAFDWLASTGKRRKEKVRKCRNQRPKITHISFQRRSRSVHCWGPATTSPIHSNCHLLPSHCHWCKAPSAVPLFAAMSWMSATLTLGECCCTFHLLSSSSCSRRSAKEFFMKRCFDNSLFRRSQRNSRAFQASKKVETITRCEMSTHKHRKPWRRVASMAQTWKCLAAISRRAGKKCGKFQSRFSLFRLRAGCENKKFIKFSPAPHSTDDDPATPEMYIKS